MPTITRTTIAAALAASFVLTAAATASVTEIGEFTGDAFEGFENISPPAPWPGAMPIFGGAATFNDEFTDPWIANSLQGGDNLLFPFDGNFMGLTPTGWSRFTFATPVSQFGGFIGTVVQGTGGSARFYDEGGQLIESMNFVTPAGEWTWHGWQSSVPIASIELDTSMNPGTTTVFDNLQMTTAVLPAPGALAVLAFGAMVTRRRRD